MSPGGKNLASSSTRARTALAVWSALAPAASRTPIPEDGRPLIYVSISELSPASSTRATSPSRTREPSGFTLSKMSRNSSAVWRRVWAVMVAVSRCPSTAGRPPSCPAEICAFCACTAVETSSGVSLKLVSLSGLSQIRIAYCEPKAFTSPTPETRLIWSCMLEKA